MPAYLTDIEFRDLTIMPDSDVDDLLARAPAFIAANLELVSADIDSRLRKRYDVPFTAPYPAKVRAWCVRLMTREAYLKRGIDPNDAQWSTIEAAANLATEEIKEAANSEVGLFDLPARADTRATGVRSAQPMAYTESSPYVQMDVQRRAARDEDANGEGSYG